jgi:predicted extracellular nuclease
MPLRIATFNTENLFTRAKIINQKSNATSTKLLNQVELLRALLAKPAYTAADKLKIKQLATALQDFIDIRENRGKVFDRKRNVTASGRGAWDGDISFKLDTFTAQQRNATAQVITSVGADVQCMVEVENIDALRRFNADFQLGFAYPLLIDALDLRGIDVGLYSRAAPIQTIRTHMYDKSGAQRIFSRDCLEVELEISAGQSLFVLCNHLKSQGYGTQAANDAKRLLQAQTLRKILQKYNLAQQLVVVLGDFNDAPAHAPLHPLLSTPDLHDVFALGGVAAAERWTYFYKKTEQIDYILVSSALKAKFVTAGVERRGMYNVAKLTAGAVQPFHGVTDWTNAASDHAAVWADFKL